MPAGRPSLYSQELADAICQGLIEGRSLRSICDDEGMPDASTVCRWLADDEKIEFRKQYAHAREAQADMLVDECLDIADDGRNDWMEIENKDGETVGWKVNGEAVRRSALRIETRQWIAARMSPRKYGNKITNELVGAEGGPIQLTDAEKGSKLAFLLRKGLKGKEASK